MGFLEYRYIYIPVIFSLPFAGCGLVAVLDFCKNKAYSSLILVAIALLLFALPLSDSLKSVAERQAPSAKMAGEWLSCRGAFKSSSLLSNGRKVPFYAHRFNEHTYADLKGIEECAIKGSFDLISIEADSETVDRPPEFSGYKRLAQFKDENFCSIIYGRN